MLIGHSVCRGVPFYAGRPLRGPSSRWLRGGRRMGTQRAGPLLVPHLCSWPLAGSPADSVGCCWARLLSCKGDLGVQRKLMQHPAIRRCWDMRVLALAWPEMTTGT